MNGGAQAGAQAGMNASAGAAAAAQIGEAIKASGVLVHVEPSDFGRILDRAEQPLVVHATGGFFTTNYQYLVGHKGLAFFTKAPAPLRMPPDCEVVRAKKIWIPG